MAGEPGGTPLGRGLTDGADITDADIKDAQQSADRSVPRAYPFLHATLIETPLGRPVPDEA